MALQFHSRLMQNPEFKRICIIISFALTYAAIWLPDFQNVAGVDGTRISSVAAFGPLNGMLLGPYWGAAVSFSAIMLHVVEYHGLSSDAFTAATPLFVMLSSVVAGLIVTKKENIALSIYSMLIISWYLSDTGREAYMLPWFHILALGCFLIYTRMSPIDASITGFQTLIMVFLISLMAILSDHMAGNISAILILDIPAKAFNSIVLTYPVERMALAALAAFIMFIIIMLTRYIILFADTLENERDYVKRAQVCDYLQNDVKKILENSEKDTDEK